MKLPSLDKLKIVYYPDPILKRVSEPVEEFSAELAALVDAMLDIKKEAKGVGLAAPQVGIPIRLFICNVTGEPGDDLVCVNPTLSGLDGAGELEEGCLSIPGVTITMRRSAKAVLNAYDARGHAFERTDDELLARVWQHEVDHLNGRLITDNMSTTDEITNRRALKQLELDFAESRSGKNGSRCASSS